MDTQQVFNDSYQRCTKDKQFFYTFYDIFWQKDEKFRRMFASTDMGKQIKMLKLSIVLLMLSTSSKESRELFNTYAERHGRGGLNVSPIDFDIWLDSLLETVAISDPLFNADVDTAWRACFQRGLALMKAACEPHSPTSTNH
ncbi:globin [Photobacterium japonica]|uniref:globin n=1 Tax=Photobacterium japonica TaxID=2910235 RepID=UPI003D1435EA